LSFIEQLAQLGGGLVQRHLAEADRRAFAQEQRSGHTPGPPLAGFSEFMILLAMMPSFSA
jgi:hypothetical protein